MEPGDPLGGDAPYDILGAERSASLVEVRDRRDELIETYERRKADARRDGDHEAFKRAVDSLSVVESAWSRIRDTHEASDDAGVDAVVLTQRDHAFNLNVGDLSDVHVLVPPGQEEEAREILETRISDEELEEASRAGRF